MRISHTALDACLGNPRHWYVSLRGSASHPYKMGYARALQLAILQYHRGSAQNAEQYLDRLVKKHNFKDARRVHKMSSDLNAYIRWSVLEHLKVVDFKAKISLPLGFLELRGEVGRIDVTKRGYRAVLFGEPSPTWRQQVRMPLIQLAIAQMYARPAEDVAVGFQELDGSNLQTTVFTAGQISAAQRRFRTLGETLRHMQ
jgi:hypothetical protein